MNSKIPTFTAKKPASSQIRSISTSTIQRPSRIPELSTISRFKRPRNDYIDNTIYKFKRNTPLSLMRRNNDLNESNKPITRLDFSESSYQSAISNISSITNATISNENDSNKKMNVESKSTSPIVDWKTITKESEIISYKVKINMLQEENETLQCKITKLNVDNQMNETKLQNELQANKNNINKLTNEVQMLKNNEEKLKKELEELQEKNNENINSLEKQKIEFDRINAKLKEELFAAQSSEERILASQAMNELNFKHEINNLNFKLEQLKEENSVYYSNSLIYETKLNELESIKNNLAEANSTIEKLKNELQSYEEGKKLEAILHGELNELRAIKNENILLKNKLELFSKEHDENLILKEKIIGHENNIKLLNEQLLQKNIDIHNFEINKEKLNNWIKITGIDSPEIALEKMNSIKENLTVLTVENDILKSEINTLKEQISNNNYLNKSLELNLNKANEKIKSLDELVKESDKKCSFLNKERDFFKKLYNDLETKQNDTRVVELQAILEEYQSNVSKLEADLKAARKELDDNKINEKENEELKNEIKRIKELNPHICTNYSMLDTSTLQTNEKQFRIIHLNDNLLSIEMNKRVEELSTLKEENQRLKCLVEILERGDANNADISKQIDEAFQYRIETLKNNLNKREKQIKNLKQIFKRYSDSFRLACMELTGYQIDNIEKNRYRLRHKYAFQNEFIVEIVGKSIKLMEDDTTKKFQDKIQFYLKEHQSYPAFFASYSLELLKNQTLI